MNNEFLNPSTVKGILASDGSLTRIILGSKSNFIKCNGELFSNEWFDYCGPFRGGFARVKLNNKWNQIDKNGKYLSNQWFEECSIFLGSVAWVQLNGEWKSIDKDGNLHNK